MSDRLIQLSKVQAAAAVVMAVAAVIGGGH